MYIIRFERILKTRSQNSEKLRKGLFNYNLSSESRNHAFTGLKTPQNCLFSFHLFFRQSSSEQKSWDDFAFLGHFPIHTGPTPPLTPQTCWTRIRYPEFFSEFQLCIGWGRKNCKKISITLHCFKREPRKRKQKNMSIAVLSQGLLNLNSNFAQTLGLTRPLGVGSVQ